MKLTVDYELGGNVSAFSAQTALARLLGYADRVARELPLEATVCNRHGLRPMPDYPIAAIAAAADGITVAGAYWLRADPVHLVLRQDCFSLDEPIPLTVEREHAEAIITSLNQHFQQENLLFVRGNSGAWYVQLTETPHMSTSLPSAAIGKNSYQFLPQGDNAAKWRSVFNEVQMLLHTHPVNAAREALGAVAVNSVWFSGGGVMPQAMPAKQEADLIIANSMFYQGLARWLGVAYQTFPADFGDIPLGSRQYEQIYLHLSGQQNPDNDWFRPILAALRHGTIKYLILNLGHYETSLTAEISTRDTWKLWCRTKPIVDFL